MLSVRCSVNNSLRARHATLAKGPLLVPSIKLSSSSSRGRILQQQQQASLHGVSSSATPPSSVRRFARSQRRSTMTTTTTTVRHRQQQQQQQLQTAKRLLFSPKQQLLLLQQNRSRMGFSTIRNASLQHRITNRMTTSNKSTIVMINPSSNASSSSPTALMSKARASTTAEAATMETMLEGAAATAASQVKAPTMRQLRLVVLNAMIPFIGFGFMDNAILIVAGDAIDTSLGVTLGITTMCAAAIGNTISDVAGILLGTAIEDFCVRVLRLPTPGLCDAQRQLASVRLANQAGTAIGIVIGCTIGMLPLLFIDCNKTHVRKQAHELDSLFQDVVTEAASLIGAERTRLFILIDDDDEQHYQQQRNTNRKKKKKETDYLTIPTPDGKFLLAKYGGTRAGITTTTMINADNNNNNNNADNDHNNSNTTRGVTSSTSHDNASATNTERHQDVQQQENNDDDHGGEEALHKLIPLGRGIVSRAVLTGQTWNIANVQDEPDWIPPTSRQAFAHNTKSLLCVPVLDNQGRVIAVLEAINKLVPTTTNNNNAKPASASHHQDDNGASTVVIGTFDHHDAQVLKALATHVGVSLQRLIQVHHDRNNTDEMRLKDTIRMIKDTGLATTREQADQTQHHTAAMYGRHHHIHHSDSVRKPLFPQDSLY